MASYIQITSVTGTSPYNVYVCDVFGTNCNLVGTIPGSVPPTVAFYVPTIFDYAPAVMVKVIDSNNCETFHIETCVSPTNPTPSTPTPTPTPTHTPTTPTPTPTRTPTPTPTRTPTTPTPTPTPTLTPTPTRTPTTPTPTPTPTLTPTPTRTPTTPTPTPTLTPTPTPTPTLTPTPTPTPTVPPIYAYVVPEPQDNGDSSTSVYKLGSYMYYLSGATVDTNVSWNGYGSSGGWADPTSVNYSYMMNKYISYSGFTSGSSGNFITPISSFKGLIRQSSGIGTDSFGCSVNQYTFETITVSTSNINPNEYYFYSVWIPLSGVGGSMTNMTIQLGYSSPPCAFDVTLTPDTTISSTNVTVTSGAAIPAGVYRVLYCSSSTLLPSSTPAINNIYFKGDTKS